MTLQPIEPSSVVGQAYDQIRTLILDGEMEPSDRLGQVELAERLGISRTPVREALLRLAGEGLVDTISNRGFRVADLGLEAVMRRLEIRLLLEPASPAWPPSVPPRRTWKRCAARSGP